MGASDDRQVYIRFSSKGERTAGAPLAPLELRPKLVADVEAQGSNLKDVILAILAERHRFAFTPAGRRTTPNANGDVCVRVPGRLYQKIATAAAGASPPQSVQRQIIVELCGHYGLEPVEPIRQTRRRRRRAPAAPASA